MWNKIQNIYIGTTKVRPKRLPSAYQEVEYIQSSGTQYIDCGLSLWSSNFEIDLDFTVNSFYSQEQAICSIWTSSYNYWNLFIRSTSYKTLDCYTTSHHETSALTAWTKYNAKLTRTSNSWVLSKDGVNTTWTYTPWRVNNTTLKLFTRWDIPWTSSSNTHINMYSCKVSVGGELQRDLIPCYRKSDTVIWLYDLVNNQFYTNSWTWTFTKWPDVN